MKQKTYRINRGAQGTPEYSVFNRVVSRVLFSVLKTRMLFVAITPVIIALILLPVLYTRSTQQVSAAPNNTINFQARLLTNTGALVPDGNYHIEFKIYDQSSGGTLHWTETRSTGNLVAVKNGYISVALGSVNPLSNASPAIDWGDDNYLTMNIGGNGGSASWNGEMSPRMLITSVPYALRASEATTLKAFNGSNTTTLSATAPTANRSILLPDADGTVCLQTSTACGFALLGSANTFTGVNTFSSAGTALQVTNNATIGGTLGVTGVTTATGGLTVGTGSNFINQGSTLFSAITISDIAGGGNIGTAAATVDVATTFNVNQTTGGQTLTLPNPTNTTAGRMAFVNNTGSTSFTMYGSVIATGKSNAFIWNGSSWVTTVSLSGSVVNTIGTLDSVAKVADGASISTNAIYLQTADASYAGLVSTGTQTFAGAKTFNGDLTVQGNTTIGNATTDRLTVTSQLLGQDALVFQGATDNGFATTLRITDPTANNIISLPNASGTVQLAPASGSYIMQTPTSTADNTISTTANAVALTVNGTTNATASTALAVSQPGAAAGVTITSSNNTATNGLSFSGAFTNLISSTNFSVANNGAVTAVGVNSGTGLIQGTGGLTLTGATSINTSGANATNIGTGTNTGTIGIGSGSAGAITIQSSGAVNTTAGAASTISTSAGALTLTSAAAATWSTTAGNLTLQAGSGTVSLGTSTALTATGALGITSGGANALSLDAGGAAALNLGLTSANAVSISRTGITTTVNGNLTVAENTNLNGNTTIGNATTDRLTVTSQVLGQDALVFQGATDNGFTTTFRITDPAANNTITFPNTSGTVQLAPASGSYIKQTPTSTADNTIATTANAVALTVNGTTNATASTALAVSQPGAAAGITVASANNTATNGLSFSGTFTNLISSTNFSVTNAGAVTAVGVNSGTGLLQGTGGLTVTGTTNINATGAGTTNIGNGSAGAIAIQSGGAVNITAGAASTWSTGANSLTVTSSNFNVSSAGVITTAGAQTRDLTTAAAATANALTIGPGSSTAATGTGAALNLRGGDQSGTTTSTGGAISILGGNATGASGTRNGGAVTIDAGTGATANGAVTIGGTNAASVGIGRSGITTTITGGLTQTTGAVSLTGNAASSFTTSAGALTLTSAAAATWSTAAGNLTLQAGSGTVSLGTSTALTATGALGITSGGANALTLDTGGAASLSVGLTNANAISISRTGITTTVNGNLTVAENTNLNGNTTIGNATTDRLTVTSQILGGSPLVFQGATDNGFATTFAITDPTANNTITFPDASGTVLLAPAGSGNGLVQVPTSNTAGTAGANVIQPTAASISGLTINATSNGTTGATALIVNQGNVNGGTFDAANINVTNTTGTIGNGLIISKSGAGTVTSLLNLTQSAGTATNGIIFNGTITTDITTAAARNLNIVTGTTGQLNLDTGSTGAINIGTNANAKTVTIGNTTGASIVNIQGGTGTAAGDINIGDTTVAGKIIDIGSVTNAATSTIRIATAAAVQTVTVGSTNSTSTTTIQAGANGANTTLALQAASGGVITMGSQTAANTINVGTVGSAAFSSTVNVGTSTGAAQTVNIGSTNSTSTTNIYGGTGNINLLTNSASANVIVKSQTNGTGFFQVQNASNVPLITANTTNMRVGIGAASTASALSITNNTAADNSLYIQNAASQSGSSLLIQNSASQDIFRVYSDGSLEITNRVTDSNSSIRVITTSTNTLFNVNSNTGFITLNGTKDATNDLLQDGGFEGGSSFVWNASEVTSGDGVYNDAANARNGNRYLRIAGSGSGVDIQTQQWFAVKPGDNIYAEGYVKSSGGNGDAGIYIIFADKDKLNPSYANAFTGTPGATYELRSITTTVPAGKTLMRIVATKRANATAGTYYFDDIYLTATTQRAPYTFKNTTNSTDAFRVQNVAGDSLIRVDTTNSAVMIGDDPGLTGAKARLYFGDYEAGTNVWVGEQSTTDTDILQLQGKNGIYLTVFGAPTNVLTLNGNGDTTFKNIANSANAFQIQNAAGNALVNVDTTSRIVTVGSQLETSTVNVGTVGTAAFSSTVNIGTSTGAAQTVNIGSTNGASSLNLNAGTGRINLNASTLQFTAGANRTINVASAAVPNTLTVAAGSATGANTNGAALYLQGGSATSGNASGGNVFVQGGTGIGTGAKGLVVLDTATYLTAATQSSATDVNITQANIDSYGAIVLNATAADVDFTLSSPTLGAAAAGRVVYVTAANGSSDFTLRANVGGGVGVEQNIAMRQNTTATMIWNGTQWTAAGASSSTTLQAAYDNTLSSAGGAEIVLNNTATANGLTVRNNATSPIIGGIFETQTSIGSNLFSVNNNATEFATNGGAETLGASASTFPANTWDATTGGTIDRWTTTGDNIATGAASVRVQTGAAINHGARNRLSTTLTNGLTYSVSFAVRGATNFTTLDIRYSPDGTTTGTTQCATAEVVTSGIWTRINCTFVASGTITSANSMLIRQTDAVARTFYIDNLSVNINASATYAADGSVDNAGAFGTNWTAFDGDGGGAGTSAAARDTGVIYDSSASARADTSNTANMGIRNNMSITPAASTQYLVSFYARAGTGAINDLTVRYSEDGGTSFVGCVDYNTQAINTTTWTKITCLFTADSTVPGSPNPDLVFTQATAPGGTRSIYIDALSITLNTNNANNVQIGGANKGGPTTLFTLDRSDTAPIAANNDAYLGSMYYDTTTGRIQCYEADGWGACGSAPDNIVNLNPEYAGAVLNGTGVGTMTADLCADQSGVLQVNATLCDGTGSPAVKATNFYKWTSPQASQQTYSIYVSYQLPTTFKSFSSDDTVQLTARVDSTTNAAVTYEMFRSEGGTLYRCGTGETSVTTTANTWQTVGINGNESTGCGFTSNSGGAYVIFKINVKANSNANAFVSTLSFVTTGK